MDKKAVLTGAEDVDNYQKVHVSHKTIQWGGGPYDHVYRNGGARARFHLVSVFVHQGLNLHSIGVES